VITISVVSHAHGELVAALLRDLASLARDDLQIILTVNVPEALPADIDDGDPRLTLIRNPSPQGFSKNHNAAFRVARGDYFCVMNPDIRLSSDPFPAVLAELADPGVGVAAPRIVDAEGKPEDSARRFPTVRSLFRKLLGLAPHLDYAIGGQPVSPDWIAGMFMLFRRAAFEKAGGFDEQYFLYYEDVDICRRLRRLGYGVRMTPAAQVMHHARRASRRDPVHMFWHVQSMLRYLTRDYS